jgi:hypothetical protein
MGGAYLEGPRATFPDRFCDGTMGQDADNAVAGPNLARKSEWARIALLVARTERQCAIGLAPTECQGQHPSAKVASGKLPQSYQEGILYRAHRRRSTIPEWWVY